MNRQAAAPRTARCWELLEHLRAAIRRDGPSSRASLQPGARQFLDAEGLGWRDWAFTYGFTVLTREGILQRERRGVYITSRDLPILPDEVQRIVEKYASGKRRKRC